MVAERRVGLRDHFVGAAEAVEVVHIDRAQISLHGVENVLDLDAQLHRLDPVDVGVELRHADIEIGKHGRQLRRLCRLGLDLRHDLIEHLVALIGAILHLELESARWCQGR